MATEIIIIIIIRPFLESENCQLLHRPLKVLVIECVWSWLLCRLMSVEKHGATVILASFNNKLLVCLWMPWDIHLESPCSLQSQFPSGSDVSHPLLEPPSYTQASQDGTNYDKIGNVSYLVHNSRQTEPAQSFSFKSIFYRVWLFS